MSKHRLLPSGPFTLASSSRSQQIQIKRSCCGLAITNRIQFRLLRILLWLSGGQWPFLRQVDQHPFLTNSTKHPVDDPSNAEECTKILKQLAPELPKATAPRRLALNSATNDEFHVLAKEYIYTALKKGIPSLFSDLKSLYKDPSKKQAIESILESAKSEFAATPAPEPKDSDEPTTYLWTLYYLAQHRSYLGQYPEALLLVDTALTHTPTLPELYTCKARLLKRSGDLIGAAQAMDEARILDGQDRFLNTKTAKYYLRAGLSEHANQMLGLFTKVCIETPFRPLI